MLCIEVKPWTVALTEQGLEPNLYDRKQYPTTASVETFLVNKRHIAFVGPGTVHMVFMSSTAGPLVEVLDLADRREKHATPPAVAAPQAGVADETFLKSLAIIVGGQLAAREYLAPDQPTK